MDEEKIKRDRDHKDGILEDTKTTLGPKGRGGTAERLEEARRQLADLTHQLALEHAEEMARVEALKSPIEKRVDRLEKVIEHIDSQITRLSGHSYRLYE